VVYKFIEEYLFSMPPLGGTFSTMINVQGLPEKLNSIFAHRNYILV